MQEVILEKAVEKCNGIISDLKVKKPTKVKEVLKREKAISHLIKTSMCDNTLTIDWLFTHLKSSEVDYQFCDPILEMIWRTYQRVNYPYYWQRESNLSETCQSELMRNLNYWFHSNKYDILHTIKPILSPTKEEQFRLYSHKKFLKNTTFESCPENIDFTRWGFILK